MPVLFDVVALTGLVLLTVGLWLVHPAAALIVLGLAFLILGLWGSRLWAYSRKRPLGS
jgi:hypothetical protein